MAASHRLIDEPVPSPGYTQAASRPEAGALAPIAEAPLVGAANTTDLDPGAAPPVPRTEQSDGAADRVDDAPRETPPVEPERQNAEGPPPT